MEMKNNIINRRTVLRTSALTMLGLSFPSVTWAEQKSNIKMSKHFPNIPPEIIEEVVGKSHFDLDGVKSLVEKDQSSQDRFGSGVLVILSLPLEPHPM